MRPTCCGKPMAKNGVAQSGKTRWRCSACRRRTTNPNVHAHETEQDEAQYKENANRLRKKIKEGVRRFVVTSAQNNTRKNNRFFQSLLQYCWYNDAELVVIPIHYKNISLYTASQEYKKTWDKELKQYLVTDEIYLGGNVVVRADINIAATTFNPLSGKEPIGGGRWTIFGHPQFAMEPVANSPGQLPKRMYTTGAVTNKNYSSTNAGAKAAFHHVNGALIVEVVGRHSFIRQLNADSKGGFYDLDKYYAPDEIISEQRILALTTGDEHVKHICPSVVKATYTNENSIVNCLCPKYIIRHDVLDGHAGNHHHDGDDVIKFKKFHVGDMDYTCELNDVVSFVNSTTPSFTTTVFVPSNHHHFLYRWLNKVDPRIDHQNALLIHELKAAQYKNALAGKTTDPFEIFMIPRLTCKFKFLHWGENFKLKGIDYTQHGDVGVNGARGSAAAFAKIATKLVIGHAHSSRIVRGVYQAGTSTGRLDYEKGLDNHTNTHCIQYLNGKRTLIDIIDGEWRL